MNELEELRQDILEVKNMLKLLMPNEFTISHVAKLSKKSRQAVREYILAHGEANIYFLEKKW